MTTRPPSEKVGEVMLAATRAPRRQAGRSATAWQAKATSVLLSFSLSVALSSRCR
jgi:hypothetical protein